LLIRSTTKQPLIFFVIRLIQFVVMKKDVLLLVIDMQYDFCFPDGALYVHGAEKDAERLGRFINKYSERIDHIVLTQDNHNVIDISHPAYWEDPNGNHPLPFMNQTGQYPT
jgi:nicotinamidase/pyrazinamidase